MAEPTPILFEPRAVFENQTEIQTETPFPILNTVDSFWFEVAAAAAVVVPTRLDLVGIEDKPVIIFEAPHTAVDEEIPARMFLEDYLEGHKSQEEFTDKDFETPIVKPEKKFKPLATTKQQLKVTAVEARCCFPEQDVPFQNKIPIAAVGSIFIRPARSLLAGKLIEPEKATVTVAEKQQLKVTVVNDRRCFPETPTRLDLVGTEGVNDIQKVVFSADNRKTAALKISRAVVELRRDSKEIPIYEIKWPSLKPIKDIPEWVWQGTAATPEEIIDWSWFLVTMFYAILNTKVLLKEGVKENFSLNQGSGFSFLEEKIN